MVPLRWHIGIAVVFLSGILSQTLPLAGSQTAVVYLLGKDALYERGCFPPCLCPVGERGPVQGKFLLKFAGFDGLFDVYDVTQVDWTVSLINGSRRATGSGTYRIGGEVALQQQLALDLSIDGAAAQRFDSGLVTGASDFPAINLPISLNGMVCFDTAFFVHAHPAIKVDLTPAGIEWDPSASNMLYDVVGGDLGALAASGGDFASSARACEAHGESGSSCPLAADPPPGAGFWYLVRAASPGGPGTYDSGDPAQRGSRDAGIDSSGRGCP